MPVVTSDVTVPSGSVIGWLDQAISRRLPSLVCQCPTCGLGEPDFHTKARNSPNASRSSVRDHEVARVAAHHLLAGEAGGALARLVEEQDAAVAIEHADERLRGLGEDPGEGLADLEGSGLRRLHRARLRVSTPVRHHAPSDALPPPPGHHARRPPRRRRAGRPLAHHRARRRPRAARVGRRRRLRGPRLDVRDQPRPARAGLRARRGRGGPGDRHRRGCGSSTTAGRSRRPG